MALVLFFLTGCGGIGPKTVARDRFEYTDAISESWKRQMLLNMVKLRYGDAPVFLDVASVINQYALEGEVQLGASWSDGLLGDSQTVGGRGKYTDRPTITYLPLIGKRFTRSLMTPIPPRAILSLVQSGWRVDLVFRLCTQAVNGIYNRSGGRIPPYPGDPDFYRLIGALRKVQEAMAVGMRIQKTEDGEQATVLFEEALESLRGSRDDSLDLALRALAARAATANGEALDDSAAERIVARFRPNEDSHRSCVLGRVPVSSSSTGVGGD